MQRYVKVIKLPNIPTTIYIQGCQHKMINELRYNTNDFHDLDIDDMVVVCDGYVYPVHVYDSSEENIEHCTNILRKLTDRYTGLRYKIFDKDGQLRDDLMYNLGHAFWNFLDIAGAIVGVVEETQNGHVINFMSQSYDVKNSKELNDFMRSDIANLFVGVLVNNEEIKETSRKKTSQIQIANPLFHGTCEKYLPNILAKGLRSKSENSVFRVHNDGYVFLTSDRSTAEEYAEMYAEHTETNPVVIQINSDRLNHDKIVLDYDITLGYDKDCYDSPYDIRGLSKMQQRKGDILSGHKRYGTKFAKIGYNGVIMPSAIEGVYVSDGNKLQFINIGTYIHNMNNNNQNENINTDGMVLTEVDASDVNLSSFKPKDELHPKFWINNKLNSRVRLRLLDIADKFIDELAIDWVEPKDIVLTGSIANYNWSKYSDVDVHILIDYKKVYNKEEFVKDYFDTKKEQWSEQHSDLKIYGFPVELYVEDANAVNHSSGIYSLNKNEWVVEPNDLQDAKLNEKYIKEKSAEMMTDIDEISDGLRHAKTEGQLDKLTRKMENIFKKAKNIRTEGLKKGGEMSSGNIIWKVLRRTGYIEKMWDVINKSYDKINTLR